MVSGSPPDVVGDDAAGVPVLVVDPDPTHRVLATRMLERLGARATAVATGAEALQLAARCRYDAVLVDAALVRESAPGLANGLRAEPGGPGPVLAAMGFAGGEDDAAAPAGFDLVLAKPVSVADVRMALGLAARDGPPAVAPSHGWEPVLDEGALRRLTDDLGDAQIVLDTVALYLDELPGRLTALRDSLAAGNARALRQTAHSLKSASAMLGAAALAGRCLALEREAAAGRLPADLVGLVVEQAQLAGAALGRYSAAGR